MARSWLGTAHLAALLLGLRLPSASGLVLSGELPVASSFTQFSGKFCYDYASRSDSDSAPGTLVVEVTWRGDADKLPKNVSDQYRPLQFLLFDDEKSRWAKVEKAWGESTCEEKIESALFVLSMDLTTEEKKSRHEVRVSQHIRPRFWYFTFLACDIPPGMEVSYKLHMTNPGWGWQQEFSFERLGTFPYMLVSSVAFAATAAATLWATCFRAVAWEQRWRAHPYVRMLLALCVFSIGACSLLVAHYARFARDGLGYGGSEVAGIVCAAMANCLMFVIAALSGMGWAISGKELQCRWQLVAGVVVLGVAGLFCELRGELIVESSTNLFAQTSALGLAVVAMKGCLFAWVYYRMRCSLHDALDARQRQFYKAFSVCFGAWSLCVPLIAFLAAFVCPWWRYKVVTMVDFAARLLGLALLAVLFGGPLSPILEDSLVSDKQVDASTFGSPSCMLADAA